MSSFLLPLLSSSRFAFRPPRRPRSLFYLISGGTLCIILVAYLFSVQRPLRPPLQPELWLRGTHPIFASQSKTLATARARYTLKNNRAPPPGYDAWFRWAREKRCLIDGYDQIHRDFEPFYQTAARNRTHFGEMVRRGADLISGDSRPGGLSNITIKGGEVFVDNDRTYFDNEWRDTLRSFAHILPDMQVLLNGNDEPRVVFDTKAPLARLRATQLGDGEPFRIAPRYTKEFFRNQSGCRLLTGDAGFATSAMDVGFIASSSTSGFTTDLWPILSFTKISPCFSDILFPSQYHYTRSWYSGKIQGNNRTPWHEKQPKLYWRGSSNGGHIIGHNYRIFPRFRLLTIAQHHPSLIDAEMTDFWGSHCTYECESEPIEKEFDIGEWHKLPREAVHRFKYLLDVDGNTFSGRYLGLLKSGSLVFKSTAFQEYFSDWLRPYEHYIPVKVDLSDLVDRVKWAIDNDDEARRIQQQGTWFAEAVLTDEQNDCYFAAVLLEWARLWDMASE